MIKKTKNIFGLLRGESTNKKQKALLTLLCASTVFVSGLSFAQANRSSEQSLDDVSQVTLNLQDVDIKVLINTCLLYTSDAADD